MSAFAGPSRRAGVDSYSRILAGIDGGRRSVRRVAEGHRGRGTAAVFRVEEAAAGAEVSRETAIFPRCRRALRRGGPIDVVGRPDRVAEATALVEPAAYLRGGWWGTTAASTAVRIYAAEP